jgi:cell division protein FtsW
MERSVRQQAPIAYVPTRPMDLWLLAIVMALLVIGSVEVFSSSAVYALKRHGESFFFLKRQMAWLGLGLGAMSVGAVSDYSWLRRWT